MFKLLLAAIIAFVLFIATAAADAKLSGYKVSDVTVSGLSSGGYMAVQMHISHSATINGSAIFAGVSCTSFLFYYFCWDSWLITFTFLMDSYRVHSIVLRAIFCMRKTNA